MIRKALATAIVAMATAAMLGSAASASTADPKSSGTDHKAAATRLALPAYKWLGANDECPTYYLCAWFSPNYVGEGVAFLNSVPNWSTIAAPYNRIDNNSSSWINEGFDDPDGRNAVILYQWPNYTGKTLCLPQFAQQPGGYNYYMDNLPSADHWVTHC